MTKILVHIFTPGNILASICAILQLHHKNDIEVTYLIANPGLQKKHLEQLTKITKKLLKPFNFVKNVFYLDNDSKHIDKLLKENKTTYEEIYYSHNVVGNLLDNLIDKYFHAKLICFGDAMGIAYNKQFYMSFFSNKINIILKMIKFLSSIKNVVYGNLIQNNNHIRKPKYALILPIDHGCQIRKDNLTIIPKKLVNKIILIINSYFKDIDIYSKKLMTTYINKNRFLLITENHAEGNFIDLEREVEMYTWIVKTYCPKNSVIFLKSHPLETFSRNELIRKSLAGDYVIVELDKKYNKYPIELWSFLIRRCKVICMSYPVLSLKYLYNIDVIQPMNKQFIKKWFKENYQKSYNMALQVYLKPLKKLDTWNGKSVLFKRNHSLFL